MDKDQKLQELEAIQIELLDIQNELNEASAVEDLLEEVEDFRKNLIYIKKDVWIKNQFDPIDNDDLKKQVDLTNSTGMNFCELTYSIRGQLVYDGLRYNFIVPQNLGKISLPKEPMHPNSIAKLMIGIHWNVREQWQAASPIFKSVGTTFFEVTFSVDSSGKKENIKILPLGDVPPEGPNKAMTKIGEITPLIDEDNIHFYLKVFIPAKSKSDTVGGGVYSWSDAVAGQGTILNLKGGTISFRTKVNDNIPSSEKKLIFESENQAILSCDQLRTLQNWWKSLDNKLKLKIKNREVYIEIIGYTTTTGDDLYNHKLGKNRALDVGKLLADMIGTDLKGKSIADIRPMSEGENTDNPQRYVKILIIEK